MESVLETLEKRFYDKEGRADLPELAAPYLERAAQAKSLHGERLVVDEFLGHLDVSHLGLMSKAAYKSMMSELTTQKSWMFGFQLVALEQGYFVDWVYEGGPAEQAGLKRGDRVLAIDGVAPEDSERLDWRTDDSALPDPPLHALLAKRGDVISVFYDRVRGGERLTAEVEAAHYSGWEATRASVKTIDAGDQTVGYVHYWFIPMAGGSKLMRELCTQTFADCDALIFDLRGRGGAAHEAMALIKMLDATEGIWRKPLVLLVHDDSRSAKEVISAELQRKDSALVVGEQTHGAVIPATFSDVGSDTYLMFPAFSLGELTERLEGTGVTPDVPVAYPLPWTAGNDPLLSAGLIAARAWCARVR